MSRINVNKKSFNIVVKATKSFIIYINDFAFAVTFLFRIKNSIRLTYIPKFITKFTQVINSRRIIISYIMKQRLSIIQTINSKRISSTYIIKEILKFTTTIRQSTPIIFVSKGIQKLVTIINQGHLTISYSPTLGQFVLLGTLDPQTLGTLDVQILEDLDFVT